MSTINLGIVDDDQLVVKLLSNFLGNQEGFSISFSVTSGEECLSQLNDHKQTPDIMLLDLNMKGMDGIELTKILRKEFPSIKIIVISSHYKSSFMGFMMKTGVSAFIPKGISPKELVNIISEVSTRGYFFNSEQLESLREQVSSKSPKPILRKKDRFSTREREILKLICQQKTAKEIGAILYITPRTVEGHKNNLFIKSGAKNTVGLVIFAIQNNLIDLNDLPDY